ncbi:hypothetical protein [Kamptonema formosum]|uniref:hypothetical protein n=1 Tax=Kamptonema formosum TaxID=331992 RepID=UPI000348EC44|nr:hypothetical protein [Oscillatoria sp. PCC 10802]
MTAAIKSKIGISSASLRTPHRLAIRNITDGRCAGIGKRGAGRLSERVAGAFACSLEPFSPPQLLPRLRNFGQDVGRLLVENTENPPAAIYLSIQMSVGRCLD